MKKSAKHSAHTAQHGDPTNVKYVKLKAKHTRPYLKRHAGSLVALIIVAVLLASSLLNYNTRTHDGLTEAQNFVSRMFSPELTTTHTFSSTYGFKISYDSQKFYASAVDTASGDLYFGDELQTKRDYDTVRISPLSDDKNSSQNSLKLHVYSGSVQTSNVEALLEKTSRDSVTAGVNLGATTVIKSTVQAAKLDGHDFKLYTWQLRAKTSPASLIPVFIASYIGIVDGRPVVININSGSSQSHTTYNDIIDSLQFTQRTHAKAAATKAVAEKTSSSRSLLDNVMFAGLARAASAAPNVSSSERTTSLYSPAVVKIYNAYCLDIVVATKLTFSGACNAVSGSGFFVNSDGTIASNGHVIASSAKDLIISEALAQVLEGNSDGFNFLATLAGIKDSDFTSSMSNSEILDTAIDKMYGIPDSDFTVTKQVSNLLVSLGSKTPDAKELVKLTKNYEEYAEQDTIKRAKLVAIDYRAIDGIKSFKASDVSLIKIGGQNYPSVALGAIDGLIQGSDLIILGFPSNASNNGIVATDASKVTLTAGKVSGIKNALGSSKKLIETDTTIGHGNSGGPALNSSGQVVGIATYTSDGSGKGNGTFNYVRDILDLKDLAKKNSIAISATSTTQTEWVKGINAFYKAHYSSAVKSFQKVKQLYAAHPKADEFIAAASDHIKNGDDVKDFPVALVAVGLLLVLLGIGATLFFILRHRKLHGVYNDHLAAGSIAPIAAGSPAVTVPSSVALVAAVPVSPTPALLNPTPAIALPQAAPATAVVAPNPVLPAAPAMASLGTTTNPDGLSTPPSPPPPAA